MIMPRSTSHAGSARRTKLFMSRPRGTHKQKAGMGELQAPMHAGDGWWVHRKRKLWAHEGARSRLSKQKLSQEVKRSPTSSLEVSASSRHAKRSYTVEWKLSFWSTSTFLFLTSDFAS